MGKREDLKINIYFFGNQTFAVMYNFETQKEIAWGRSKCDPHDKFDPQIGAMIALARMFGDEVEYNTDDDDEYKHYTEHERNLIDNGYHLIRDGYPKKDGKYLLRVPNTSGIGESEFELNYTKKHGVFHSVDSLKDLEPLESSIEYYKDAWKDAIAWKPLPKPYKGGDADETD